MKEESDKTRSMLQDGMLPRDRSVRESQKAARWDSLLTNEQQEKRQRMKGKETISPSDQALFELMTKNQGNYQPVEVEGEKEDLLKAEVAGTTKAQVNPQKRGFLALFTPELSEDLARKKTLKSQIWGSSQPKFPKV